MIAKTDIVLLAAGGGTRMRGGDKTLEVVDGLPLLRRLSLEALASKATKTHVVIPTDRPERASVISDLEIDIVTSPDAHMGMSASLKAGIRAARSADAALIMLGDMPEVTRTHLDLLISAFQPNTDTSIIRATSEDGKPGHPVLFARSHFDQLLSIEGDAGARAILRQNRENVQLLPLPGDVAVTDLDTPEAWANWRDKSKQ